MRDTQKDLYKKLLGRGGEGRAARFLKKNRYKILKKNYTVKQGEIDIIAEKDGVIVFVEVKTRSSLAFGRPSESVNTVKREKIRRCAEVYIAERELYDKEVRFDVIEILEDEITHITDAF